MKVTLIIQNKNQYKKRLQYQIGSYYLVTLYKDTLTHSVVLPINKLWLTRKLIGNKLIHIILKIVILLLLCLIYLKRIIPINKKKYLIKFN